jgi:hypothetical protein
MRFELLGSLIACLLLAAAPPAHATDILPTADGLGMHLNDASGAYSLTSWQTSWTFSGSLGAVPHHVVTAAGKDRVGAYHEIAFHLTLGDVPLTGSMRAYDDNPIALFSLSPDVATTKLPIDFPAFTSLPSNLRVFGYEGKVFSPPAFAAEPDGSPWLLFDEKFHAAILSPAAHFAVERIGGDGKTSASGEFRPTLKTIPAGFAQRTLLVVDQGINRTWDKWGHAMTDLQGKDRPANDSDPTLKYLGYWTDNGGFYYYHYDADTGYAGTLLALADHFRKSKVPVRYLQLDSWWYYKTLTGPDGKDGKPKSATLPKEEWNRYGGLLEYRAHPTVFPDGLAAFQAHLGMPLVTHNRWIDPKSPYHEKYKISGFAGVDPAYWKAIADYCKSSGVITYEQDWLNQISLHSPELASTPDLGDAFLDGMANACRDNGMTVQYCMPLPWDIMQESKYSNLTTSRASDDRFQHSRWMPFLYTSRFVSALGTWPWTDVYLSTETDNLLLSVLSGGIVGFGDEQGKENRDDLLKAVREDGMIVKPDAAIVPIDAAYLSGGDLTTPIISSTFTDHGGLKTEYVFAFIPAKSQASEAHFTPDDLGMDGKVFVHDCFKGTGHEIDAASDVTAAVKANGFAFYVVAPVGKSGIAFLGDAGKFVGTGRQRVATMEDTSAGLNADILFAASESAITLHGYSISRPQVTAQSGTAGEVHYDEKTKYFSCEVKADHSQPLDNSTGDPVRHVKVRLANH